MSGDTLNPRERACVLAALAFWEVRNLPRLQPGQRQEIEKIAFEAGPSLDCEEIGRLCERLNFGEETSATTTRNKSHATTPR